PIGQVAPIVGSPRRPAGQGRALGADSPGSRVRGRPGSSPPDGSVSPGAAPMPGGSKEREDNGTSAGGNRAGLGGPGAGRGGTGRRGRASQRGRARQHRASGWRRGRGRRRGYGWPGRFVAAGGAAYAAVHG